MYSGRISTYTTQDILSLINIMSAYND